MSETFLYQPVPVEIYCEHKKAAGCHTYVYHRHDGYEIYLFLQGNIHLYVESNCYHLSRGDMMLISPANMHRIVSLDEKLYERIIINLKPSVLERLSTPATDLSSCFSAFQGELPVPVHLTQDQMDQFMDCTHNLSRVLASDEFGADVRANIHTSQLLLLINSCFQNSPVSRPDIMPELIKNVILFIQENLTEDLSLTRLSEEFYRSGVCISRQFKAHTGLTLREYILDCRIEKAKKLLAQGASVSEACFSSGFHDYANFIRSFTKITGISPGKYRS